MEEAWQGREYVSESMSASATNPSSSLSLSAAAADLFRGTLVGSSTSGGGTSNSGGDRFGADAKMTATTTTQFFDVSN